MKRSIKITAGPVELYGVLHASATADAIWNALPLSSTAQTWGDEIYFDVPVRAGLDDTARDVVNKGDLGYWPSGPAFCIFFGPTPMSRGEEIRPASAVNVFGAITGDLSVLKGVNSGSAVLVEKAPG
ncbi:MAG: cyclophilin-like fold protein [Proteobacteria bacterium]|nr:cyclophilin-like fold protein [Pseudomonadota bacterium]